MTVSSFNDFKPNIISPASKSYPTISDKRLLALLIAKLGKLK
jgi:hypothetical protein